MLSSHVSLWPDFYLAVFFPRVENYLNGKREDSARNVPLLFVASPSAKDPTWEERSPGTEM